MGRSEKSFLLALLVVGLYSFNTVPASMAQVQRYEPSRPTVSPYLNLFRNDNDNNRFLPNYHALVRPLQQQYRTNQIQHRVLREQSQALRRLNTNFQDIEERAAAGQLVAPTGKGSWFGRPSRRSTYLNTSRYYAQAGSSRQRQ